MRYARSQEYLEQALKVVPLGTQTLSKGFRYFPQGAYPYFIHTGKGSHVWDVDGHEYIDYIMALCPITLGWQYPAVDKAIKNQLKRGITFSLPSPLEYELAEILTDIMPGVEMVRFLKTGSEATSAAIRAARSFTGRNHIAFRGYHGWHEWYASGPACDRQKGIPPDYAQYMHQFHYNDTGLLQTILRTYPVACVIMEPTIIDAPSPGFLQTVKDLCHETGTLLIFDEVVTGFRFPGFSASSYFGVTPDLITFGKGMGNGMPIAAVGGRRDIMREFEDIMVSSTFGGECLSLAASMATIHEMIKKPVIETIWERGRELKIGLASLGLGTGGYPCRVAILNQFSQEEKSLLLELMAEKGLLIHPNLIMNLCYSHSKRDIERTLSIIGDCLDLMHRGEVRVPATLLQPAFKRL